MTSPETASARREIHHRLDAAAPRGLHVPANLLGKLAPYHPHPAIVLLEALLLPAAALGLGLLWAPQDPLQTQGPVFPGPGWHPSSWPCATARCRAWAPHWCCWPVGWR